MRSMWRYLTRPLLALALAGCGSGKLVTVRVTGDRANGQRLTVRPYLNDKVSSTLQSYSIDAASLDLLFRDEERGLLQVNVASLDADGCIASFGTESRQLPTTGDMSLTVTLVRRASRYCSP